MHTSFTKIKASALANWPKVEIGPSLVAHVKQLSDMYAARNSQLSRIWENEKYIQAYLAYFTPLNILRLKAVVTEADSMDFFAGLETLIDFGSGPGTTDFALNDFKNSFRKMFFIESGESAKRWHREHVSMIATQKADREWLSHWSENIPAQKSKTLGSFSYSLNELTELPAWAYDLEALMILEPSTQAQGRALQETRQKLIDRGFSIWAPCVHQGKCPLLTHSKTDWCHNRVFVDLPAHLLELETHLPMKNQSLTYSYLLARKTPRTETEKVRVIGDTLFERGKIKQAICRNEKREFFSWLTRDGEPQPIPRGSLLDWPADAVAKGDEWRLKS